MFSRFKQKEIVKKNREQRQGSSLITLQRPNDIVSEQFRTIRTNIQFAMEEQKFKSIMFTSSGAWEGKSTIVANIATVMADLNLRVCIVDCDLRKPTIHKTFDVDEPSGLTSLLTQRELKTMNYVQYVPEANLYVLPAGPKPPNPAELLSSQRMADIIDELEQLFDLVIIDTPPILLVTDAQIMASRVDNVIFVLRENVSQIRNVQKSKELLDAVNANVLGAIYNGAVGDAINSYYGYGYHDEEV
ncbi:CpsD/CapB family tyrosine-protein kinase [Aerococcus sanguinicola]|uniref:non-specific protein-tyrosine kinase n=1 Tax=Aerococcus sanguinicola TaxID=119206 RepID=A0A2I1MQS1_9LACT|nr:MULTISPECIES: CpsD/CapB family tyrosine-protein kinase [Aerococcus]MDK6233306.1 CpsD/CapB family tyrosine-protein kinase [Aerococcus sp. UMB10185]MDK6804934.1 CpsD/CapB family tyrosine-protein kinase [Aerococcus sp. UMB7834]MDK6855134.1 CpsD/CapB family tyrosine-protein kinase [Aerococcus sp. UMB7533]MDK7049912.1 CpsD/CapB family tyrosine-protein kinase [Aerococcus sanguinicola]MDK8501950.1 CpsD/CapB family tyrosine-protein kinase [Aerococcus sp. UMB1112A]